MCPPPPPPPPPRPASYLVSVLVGLYMLGTYQRGPTVCPPPTTTTMPCILSCQRPGRPIHVGYLPERSHSVPPPPPPRPASYLVSVLVGLYMLGTYQRGPTVCPPPPPPRPASYLVSVLVGLYMLGTYQRGPTVCPPHHPALRLILSASW